MKFWRGLACTLLMTLLLGTIANAAVSEYPSIKWSKITYTDPSENTGVVMISIDGVVGIPVVEGQSANVAELPFTFLDLYNQDEVWANEDGTFTVWTDIEVVMTREELIKNYANDSIQIIPVVNGATLTIQNLKDSESVAFNPSGYAFIDKEKTILAKELGQLDNYSTDRPYAFQLWDTATGGMNDFTLDFPITNMVIDGSEVSYQILTVSEEKAKELMETISEADDASVTDAAEETTYTAEPTTTNIEINGKPVAFDAYLIKNNNYIKLRDFAMALNGASKQFNVTWDQEKKAVNMFSNTPYAPVGGEMAKGDGTSKTAVVTTSKLYKDNQEISLQAYVINNNNYFKLRDIAKAFDIGVTWDGETLTAGLHTNSSYQD